MLRADHLQHALIGVAFPLAFWLAGAALWGLFSLPAWLPLALSLVGWFGAFCLFYGREHRDAQIKLCAALRCNLAALPWTQYLPWTWCRDGRWDFFCPLASSTATVCLVNLCGPAWAFLRNF